MIRVDVPEYNTFVEFPDGTPPDEMSKVLSTNFPHKQSFMQKVGGLAKQAVDPYVGMAEGLMSTITGMASLPIAGIGGLAKTITSGADEGNRTIEEISNALTYKPKTETGQATQELIGKGFETFLDKPADIIGENLGVTPAGKTISKTIATMAIPAIFGGLKGSKIKPNEIINKIDDPIQRQQFTKDILKESAETKKPVEEVIASKMPQERPSTLPQVEQKDVEQGKDMGEGEIIATGEPQAKEGVKEQPQPAKKDLTVEKQPWEMTKEEYIYGTKPQREGYSEGILSLKGLGKPGIEIEQRNIKVGNRIDEGVDITYRNQDGLPIAIARLSKDTNGKLAVDDFGVRKKSGLLRGRAVLAIGEEIEKLGANRPLDVMSPDAAKVYHHRLVQQALSEGKPVPPEVLKDYPDLVKVPSLESMEAQVKGGATKDLPKYAEGSAINLERLDTTNDIKQTLNNLTKQFEEKIGKKSVSWEETRQMAENLGWDAKELIKQKKGRAFTAAEIEAGRQVNINTVTDIHEFLKTLPADRSQITPEMRLQFLDKINTAGEVLKTISSASSEAGRALNIHKRMMANDPEFGATVRFNKLTKTIIENSGVEKLSDQIIADLKKVDFNNPKEVNQVINKYHQAKLSDKLFELWINMLLSNPKTHAVNVTSNALMYLTKPTLEMPVSAAIDAMIRGKNRGVYFGEIKPEVFGAWQGIKEGSRAFLQAFKTGEPSDLWGKVEVNYPRAIKGIKGEAARIPTKLLLAEDEFAKSIIYRAEINKQAYRNARNEGLKGDTLAERVTELQNTPTPEMMNLAHKEALYRTFNQPLGKYGQNLQRLRDFPGVKYFIPFLRTPTNIAKFALERTPANYAKIAYDYKKGLISKEELSGELAKPTIGTILGITTVMLASEGYITGGGPKEKTKREALMRTGWQPYSFHPNDNYYGFNRFEPLGSILGMAADLQEMSVNKYGTEGEKQHLAGKIAMSITKNLTSKTFLSGLSNIIDGISDPERYGENVVNQLVGSVVPSIVGGVTNITDKIVRKSNNPLQAIERRIPILSETLLPRRNIWGEELEKVGDPVTRGISPLPITENKNSKIDNELVRLNLHPAMPSEKVKGIELTPEEYDKYSKKAGERAKQMVERYMALGSYSAQRDEIKKLAITRLIEAARTVEANNIWQSMDRQRRMEPIKKKYGLGGQ